MKSRRLIAAAIACLLIAPTMAGTPLKGWSFLRGDDDWEPRKGAFLLRAQKGRIWAGTGANLLLHGEKAGGKTLTFDVTHDDPKTKYEQGGALVYRDDDHFVKFVNEFIDGKYYVVLGREIGGKRKVFSKIKIPDKGIRLRIVVAGDKVTAGFAKQGSDHFKSAGGCDFPGASEARFGFFTQDGSDRALRWIRFEKVAVAATDRFLKAFEKVPADKDDDG